MKLTFLALAAPALAACASTGDYPGMTPAPAAYTPLPITETITPFDNGAEWTIQRTPPVMAPLRTYNTDGSSYANQRQLQPGVLPPMRSYRTDGSYTPVLVQ